VESMRARLSGGEDEQANFFHDKVAPFHGMVRLLLEENQNLEALQYAERAKARLLLDVLKSGKLEITGSMTGSEKRRERELSDAVVTADSALARERNAAKTASLLLAWQKSAEELDSWRSALYSAHPGLRLSRGELQPVSVDELDGLLPDSRTALLEYTVTRDAIYLFAIARGARGKPQLTVYTLKSSGDLARQIEDFRQALLSRDLGYREKAARLYGRVLGPVADVIRGKKLLVIVPDGPLWNLPFQALISPLGHHLIEDAAVFYAPSLTASREVLRLQRTSNQRRHMLLAFGGPVVGDGLPSLPESVREAQQLGQIYSGAASAVFVEKQATKERWKAAAPDYRILHLAVHGVLDGSNPLYSYLALGSDSKSPENGRLTAREILGTNLHADLAVLSACESARGNFRFGEGLIGMSWAFLVAGTPAIVVSQWKVDSASTRQLMVTFHTNLRDSGSAALTGRARSLQRAAIELLHSPEYGHPFYWAGFVLIGNGY
jgi:CHAT domain-containing protein